jgi:hypothetical protein
MSEFPSLSGHIAGHTYLFGFETNCSCGHPGIWTWDDYRAHLADAWRAACEVRTVDQVLIIPAGTVIHADGEGAIEKFSDGRWYLPGRRDAISIQRVVDALPALLIHHPAWERP